MRFLQSSLVVLVVVFFLLVGAVVVYGQTENPEPGYYISQSTGVALSVVIALIATIAGLAFKAGYAARRQYELEARIVHLEEKMQSQASEKKK